AGARAALRPHRVPQRRDLLRPGDAGAPLLALRRGARARRHAAPGQGRDAVRPGARAPRAGGAARADLPQGRRVTNKRKQPSAPKERIVKVADWAAERGDAVIVTLGLGSCVAIMLHDPNAGGGGAGRSVRFFVADGRVEIRSVGVDAIVL